MALDYSKWDKLECCLSDEEDEDETNLDDKGLDGLQLRYVGSCKPGLLPAPRHWVYRCTASIASVHVLLGFLLFASGEPWLYAISERLNFKEHRFAVAWGGWKFCGFAHMALANLGVDPRASNAAVIAGYLFFDILGALDRGNRPLLAALFAGVHAAAGFSVVLGVQVLGLAANVALLLAGIFVVSTGEAQVLVSFTGVQEEKFAVTWFGWALCACLFYVLVNTGADLGLANATTAVGFFCFDLVAVSDTRHFTNVAFIFVAADLGLAVAGLCAPPYPAFGGAFSRHRPRHPPAEFVKPKTA